MADDPRAVNRRFNDEVINGGKLDVVDELVTEDIVEHVPLPGQGPGPEGIKRVVTGFFTAFPDLRMEVVEELAEGEVVAQDVRFTGTHRGEFMGMPATGRSISVLGSDFVRVRDGRIVGRWGFIDQGAMKQQLGVMPEGPPGG